MAPTHSLSRFLTLVLTYCCSLILAAPWIVTDYYEEVRVTPYGYGPYASEYVTTSIDEVSPTVTSLPEALSTTTSVGSSYYEDDVTVIQKLYPSGIGKQIYNSDDGYGYSAEDGFHSSIYVVNLTYTAPTGCSSRWTNTTTGTVEPPSAVRTLLPLTATSLSTSVDTSQAFQSTTYFYTVVWVDPTQVPSASLDCLSDKHVPTALYEGSSCRYQGHGCYYTNGYYGGNYDPTAWYNDSYWYGISPLAIILIGVLGWIGLFFILGIIEAWVRFDRLMTGWQTRRGLPVFWAFMLLPLSLFFLFCFRKGYRARNAADAAFLQQKWRDMSPWKKFRLFLIWGFRFKYPDVLGPAPPRAKVSKRPGKDASSAPLLYPQPYSQRLPTVQEVPEASGAIAGERDAPAASPEMGEASTHVPHLPVQGVAPGAPAQHNDSEVSGAQSGGNVEEIGRAR